MKHTQKIAIVLCIVLAGVLIQGPGQIRAADCAADPGWFKSAGPDPVATDIHLPPGTDECEFYKVAWQTFLQITHPENPGGYPRFVHFAAPIDIFHNRAQTRLATKTHAGPLHLLPRATKTRHATTIDDVLQSISRGVLIDHSGHAVYYGTHLNKIFVKFIKDHGFDQDVTKIAHAGADTPIDPGSIELKSTWKILDPKQDDPSQFFTIKNDVPRLKVIDDPMHPGQKTVATDFDSEPLHPTLGLVGLHVAITIKEHPEFIWATFEHVRNAPGLAGQGVGPDDAVDGSSDYTFYDLGTKRSECNFNNRGMLSLNAATQVFSPITQVYRQFKYGKPDVNGLNQPDDEVTALNRDVHAKLKAKKSIWQNYYLVGAVWIDDPAHQFNTGVTAFEDPVLAGEKRLSNSTIETFTQADSSPNRSNCFRCHVTAEQSKTVNGMTLTLPTQKINVSHALVNAFFRQ
jgi:hypothetical protein